VYTVLRAVWWGQKRFVLLGSTELVEQLSKILIFGLLLSLAFWFDDLVVMAALAFTLGCFVSATVVVILFHRKSKRAINDHHYENDKLIPTIKTLTKTASPITAVRVIATISLPIIAIILPLRLQAFGWPRADAVAAFGIAVGMTLPLLSIPQTVISSMATALVPELSSARERGDQVAISRAINNCIRFTLFVNFLLIPPFMAVGEGIGLFLFANADAGIYLQQSAWVMVPLSLSLITNAILNSLGSETRAMNHYVLGSVALFISIWFLPGAIGVGSLIVGLGICTSIAALLNIALIAKKTGTWISIAQIIGCFVLVSIPAIFAGQFIYGIINTSLPLVFTLTLAGGVSVLTFLLLSYSFSLVDFSSIKVRHKKQTYLQS